MGASTSRDEDEDFNLSDLDQLPQELRHKVELQFMKQKSYIQEIENKYEKLRVDSEQRYFEIERSFIDSQGKLSAETTSAAQLRVELSTLEKKYNETAHNYRVTQEKEFDFTRQKDALQRTNINLEAEKHELANLLEQKNRELDKLSDEWKSMSMKVSEINKEKIAAMSKCDAAEAQFVSLEHKASSVNQEKEQLQQENMWLEKELKQKTDELLALRKDNSSKVLQLQSQLDERTLELTQAHDLHTTQQDRNNKLATQTETYIQRLKEQKDLQAQSDQQYRSELQAQEKLTQLYKTSSEESDAHVQQLTIAVEELQKMLKQAADATKELESLRKEDEIRFNEEFENKETVTIQLKRELEDANELLEIARKKGLANLSDENLEALSPSAAAASRLLKSGMTLTQIYSEYVQATENLQIEKDENSRLNQYLDQILQEIEEKAPIMKQQREDYEKCLETIDHITRQLDTAMMESEKLRIHDDETSRRFGEASRENSRLKMQCTDMSSQIRMLLKELEEARGTMVRVSEIETVTPNLGSGNRSAAQNIISKNLVTFRSIEELQEQNQKLLSVVRDLSERQEELEQSAVDSKTQELNRRLEESLGEIEELKSMRDRAAKMVESIVRQRDMYRVLLAQTAGGEMMPVPGDQNQLPDTPGSQRVMPQTPKTPTSPGLQLQALEETRKALKELQEEFSLYRREKGENEKLMSSQLDQFRQSDSEMKMQNAKIASQLDYSAERYKVLQSNIEGYMKEIAALREKNQVYSGSIVKHEQTIATMREELMRLQGQLTESQVQVQHLNTKNSTLRSIEARLAQEKEATLRENRSTQLLMANLQTIQNNLERSEFEMKTTLNNRISQLDRENTAMRRKLDNAQDHQRGVIQSLEQQLTQARELLGQEDQSHRETHKQLKMEKISTEQLKTQLTEVKTQYEAAQTRLKQMSETQKELLPVASGSNDDELKHLQNQISTSQAEIKGLQDQLNKAKQHAEQYKSIAESMEKSMTEQNKTSKEFADKLEGEIKAKQEAVEESQNLVQAAEQEKQRLFEENLKLTQDINTSNADMRKQLKTLQTELQVALERKESAIVTETAAKTDSRQQQQRASENQDKYERELILHAADVNALAQVKEELEGFHEKLRDAEKSAKEAKETLEYQKHCWDEQEKILKEDRKKLQKRNDDILEQNSVLHDQLEQLSSQMSRLQERKDQEAHETDALAEKMAKDPTEKTQEQLLEVIKFIRKEKSIVEAKHDVVQAESTRYKQRLDLVEKQLEDSTQTLQAERETAQVSIQTAAQHADLLRKVENLNLLQDSNRHLREEKDRLVQQVKTLETRAKKLEDEIEPLQANLRDVTVERDTLQAENEARKTEIDSWKTRTNHLIEQCNRFDPEEFKQAVKDRDQLKLNNHGLKEDINKLKIEKVNLNMQISSLKNEETAAKKKIEDLTAEKNKLSTDAEAKDKDIEAKNQTINQLKTIGRRYRKETQDANQELEKLKKNQQQGNIQEFQDKLKAAEEKLKASEEKVKTLEEKSNKAESSLKAAEVKSSSIELQKKTFEEKFKGVENTLKATELAKKTVEEKLNANEEQLGLLVSNSKAAEEKNKLLEQEKTVAAASAQSLEKEKGEMQKKLSESESKMKSLDTQITKLNEEIVSLKQSCTTMEKEKLEADKQKDHTKKLLASARPRLVQQKNEIETLKKELEKLKTAPQTTDEKEQQQRVSSLQSECEQLRKELSAAQSTKQELEALQRQYNELQTRCTQLQKHLEMYQRQIQSPPGSQAQPSSEPPKTANIRPMTAPTSSPQVRMAQATPIQPVRSTSTVETRAMASIRPMAASLATSSVASSNVSVPSTSTSQTPMATVHPTTQEGEGMMSPLHVTTTTQGRPTQTVQPVSPHIEEPSSSDIPATQESATSTPATTVTSSLFSSSTSGAAAVVTQSSSTLASAGLFVSGVGASIFGGKRAREEEQDVTRSESQPEGPNKKTKTTDEPEAQTSTSGADLHPVSQETAASTSTAAMLRNRGEISVALVEPERTAAPSGNEVQEAVVTNEAGSTQQEECEELPEFTETEEDEPKEEEIEKPSTTTSGVHRPSQPVDVSTGTRSVEVDTGVTTTTESAEPVIVVEDENAQEADYIDQDQLEGEEFEEDQYIEGEQEMEEQYEEERMDGDEAEDIEEEDDDIVIIGDDEEEEVSLGTGGTIAEDSLPHVGVMETQGSGSSGTSSTGISSQLSEPARLGPPMGVARLPSSGSRTQLQPFSFGGEGGAAEFGDDGIVPSTPTLFVPRRNDGFAEAISSPLVSRQFVFGSQTDSSTGPDFGQLAGQGLDAPCMDFSHFERSDTRSPQPLGGSMSSQGSSSRPHTVISETQQTSAQEGAAGEQSRPQDSGKATPVTAETGVEHITGGEELVIRYPPKKPTLLEEPVAGVSTSQHGEGQQIPVLILSPATDRSADDSQDTQIKTKIEPIVWDHPSSSSGSGPSAPGSVATPPHAANQPVHMPAPPQGTIGGASNQQQPILPLGTSPPQQRGFSHQVQPVFRSRAGHVRGHNTAFRARPLQQRGGLQMRQRGMPGQSLRGNLGRGGRRGSYRGQQF